MYWQKTISSSRFLTFLGLLWLLLSLIIVGTEFGRQPTIQISWVTETEFDTAGFNIYRDTDPNGSFTHQVNEQLIPSQAEPDSGASYQFTDNNVEPGTIYYYRLEDVEFNNTREQHDIFNGEATSIPPNIIFLAIASAITGIFLIIISLRPSPSAHKHTPSSPLP
ncbi:MAG TPA: hypothetical protein VLL52_20770 [Anaerolineae bacterium]|nr:hypothetical protein [Anaerolineae bacterium]